jgi:hypothetical protein
LLRVTKPGSGRVGQLDARRFHRENVRCLQSAPAAATPGVPSPMAWGNEATVRSRL